MAKKKSVKKIIKKPSKKKSVKLSLNFPIKKVRYDKKKFKIVLKNLILFSVLFILSLIFYNIFGKEIYESFFFLLSIILGFISVAFLIIFLIFVFLKILKK